MAEYQTGEVDKDYARYRAEIDLYEREFKPWETRGKKIVKLYKDVDNQRGSKKRFNILWSNVQTLKPALYARDPQPQAERRFKDADPVGRAASEVLERCLAYTIDCHGYGQVMRQIVDDRLLPGRGVAWVRYEPTIEGEGEDESLAYEQAIPDYVYWEDFGHNIARTWDEVTMVWRRVYMSRAKLVKRFGDVGNQIPLDYSPRGLKDEKTSEDIKKACVYEIWDKEARKVCFLSKGYPKLIEAKDDPLQLTGMFPCPRPLFATLTNDSLIPVPDYALYQTQAVEIEELTARINSLQKALKVAGVYDSSAPELVRLLNEGFENKLIPVDKWAAFAERGGLDGAVDFLPLKDVVETLVALYEAREKAKEDLYELTGIADIIRGNSDPRETAKAQQIKGRFAVLRISDSQSDVQRFVRDLNRIMGEVIAEHFSLETIQQISGIKLLTAAEKQAIQAKMQQQAVAQQMAQSMGQQAPQGPQIPPEIQELMGQPTWEEVHELLRHQVLREFRIDIETDSTIRTDEDADREERTEFLNVAGGYIQQAIAAMQLAPELGPLLGELLMFGVRGHPAARNLEPAFEDAMKQLSKPKPAPPNPDVMKIQAEKELKQQQMQLEVQTETAKQQSQHEQEMARQQMEDQRAERDAQRTEAIERYKAELEMQVTREKIAAEAQAKIEVAKIQAQQAEQDRQMEHVNRAADRDSEERMRTHEAEQKRQEREFTEKTRAEDKASGEARKQHDAERTKTRESHLQAAQKLVDALAALRSQVH